MVKHTTIPFAPFTPPGATPSLARLAYDRLGFGPRPGATDFNDVTSLNAYIDAQLAPEVIDDSACDAYIAGMSRLDSAGFTMPAPDATTAQIRQYVAATTAYGPGELGEFLRKATTARAIFSKRQLLEAMVDFWNNHLNTTINTSQYKYWEDRYVMREFALGNFRDILGASAKSPSMLAFLSNRYSDGSNPNENYARELLELHSMSPTNHIPGDPQNGQANYTEVDVHTLAQILSGWTNTHSEEDEFEFNDSPYWPSHHYPPKKLYLGGNTPIYFSVWRARARRIRAGCDLGAQKHRVFHLLEVVPKIHQRCARYVLPKCGCGGHERLHCQLRQHPRNTPRYFEGRLPRRGF